MSDHLQPSVLYEDLSTQPTKAKKVQVVEEFMHHLIPASKNSSLCKHLFKVILLKDYSCSQEHVSSRFSPASASRRHSAAPPPLISLCEWHTHDPTPSPIISLFVCFCFYCAFPIPFPFTPHLPHPLPFSLIYNRYQSSF